MAQADPKSSATSPRIDVKTSLEDASGEQPLNGKDELSLRDKSGREIQAKLLSATGENVRIKRLDDDREFELRLAQLDERSVRSIEKWIEDEPEAVDYSVDFDVEKKMLDSDEFQASGRKLKTTEWAYDIKLTNLTRNDLRDASVEYRVVYDDEVAFTRTSAFPGKGEKRQEGNEAALPDLDYNAKAEFVTPAVALHTYEYKPSRGDVEFERDKLIGIWIRVVKKGVVLDEYISNQAVMDELEWDEDKNEEIKITDSFEEKFNDSDKD